MLEVFGLLGIGAEIALTLGRFTVIAVNRIKDLLLGREHGVHSQAGAVANGRDGFEIERVGHRQCHGVVFAADGEATELAQEFGRKRFRFRRGGGRSLD